LRSSTAALGRRADRTRTVAFVLGGCLAGLSGGLLVQYVGAWAPGSWTYPETFLIFTAIVVGGTGNLLGGVVGALLVPILIIEGTRFLPEIGYPGLTASLDWVVMGLVLLGFLADGHILLELLDHVDPLVTPLVIDEIGVAADREALGKLLTIADGDLPTGGGPYLRVKAVEAVGRINAPESISTLKRIAESKKVFGWLHPQELRIAALQALEKLDPEWVREFLPKSGIEKEEYTLAPLDVPVTSKFVRQRRHTRVRLKKAVRAICTNLKEGCSLEIKTASLTGGVATLSRHLTPGTQVQLRFQIGMRNFHVTALMRDSRAQDMAFEIVDMDLDERGKYRRLLAGNLSASSNNQTAAENDLVPVPAGLVGSK